MSKKRLDQLLLERGLVDSREKAKVLLMTGLVNVAGRKTLKPGSMVSADVQISVKEGPSYVGRGGTKLAHALDHFGLDPAGKVILDVGASTGGFVDCLLQRGVARVYALDVGYGQLDYKIRSDPRVIVMERTNARYPFGLPEVVDVISVDISFISLTKVLPSVAEHLKEGGLLLALVKPQFEARVEEVGKGGVIRDSRLHARVLGRLILWTIGQRWRLLDLTPSPILGAEGNREFFLLVRP